MLLKVIRSIKIRKFIAWEHSFMTYDFRSYECFLGHYVKEVHNLGAFFNDICFRS
jgi:hypothetical protein